MRAILADSFGSAEVLNLQDIAKPQPGVGEVLVKVHAAGVNPIDIQTRKGDYSDFVTGPYQLGVELSGVIEMLGEGVDNFEVGDEVFYSARVLENEGGYAQYHTEKAELLARKPAKLSFEEAAAMPIAASTAWVCLVERGRIQAGDRVLVLGGSGGVGLFALQIARLSGAITVTTSSSDATGLVIANGAETAIDYRADDAWDMLKESSEGGFDIILDLVGGDSIERSLRLLTPGGRMVSIVDQDTPQNLMAGWDFNAEIHLVFLQPSAERLTRLAALAEKGLLTANIEGSLPLEEAAKAHQMIEAGGRSGKIILTMNEDQT